MVFGFVLDFSLGCLLVSVLFLVQILLLCWPLVVADHTTIYTLLIFDTLDQRLDRMSKMLVPLEVNMLFKGLHSVLLLATELGLQPDLTSSLNSIQSVKLGSSFNLLSNFVLELFASVEGHFDCFSFVLFRFSFVVFRSKTV